MISALNVRDGFSDILTFERTDTRSAHFSDYAYFERFLKNIVSLNRKLPFPVRPCNRWAPFSFGQTSGAEGEEWFAAEKAGARYR